MNRFKTLFLISGLAAACCPALAAQEAAAPAAEEAAAVPAEAPAAAVEAPPAVPAAGPAPAEKKTGLMDAEWEFLKTAGESKDEDALVIVLPQAADWLRAYPAAQYAGDALLLKAKLHLKLGDHRSALVALLRHSREYPQSASSAEAAKLFTETAEKKADKKTRPLLAALFKAPLTGDGEQELAALLEKLSAQAGETFYEALTAEFREFFSRFPAYAGNDGLRMALADLHLKKEEYLPARLAYEKMVRMHPASSMLPRVKLALGGVLANNLKEYEEAIKVYQDLTVAFPGSGEAWAAYAQLPKLMERQKKYQAAAEVYEQIITLYPDKEAAYESFTSQARVLREEMAKPGQAVTVLGRLADKYKGEKAIEALLLAAEIHRKDLKDSDGEVKMYDRIVAEYPSDPQAPKALYAAGEVYEKSLALDKAGEYYSKIIAKYADNSMAKKAQKRIDAMNGK
ncbi:MAG: hypothetical protein A2X35_12265 [Elusimicrobia bacterium GWA2_61_42]|nr:MAG: hypothetical protein A2X35_12265 [Elusimicrobia bacterium GWA2_61_42]OGR80508.1 MAG: hypothetical protein A2X38_02890 [Elusimicrobia bacterium GWC2_61_25]